MSRLAFLALTFACAALAQTRPPVVLMNGYQGKCTSGTTSTATFGQLEQLLAAQRIQVYFFDNCKVPATSYSRPTIEELGQAFGDFIQNLGAPQVDVVAHSMGGLILRSYLAGKLPGGGFSPPATTRVRKAILLGTPNFGALALVSLFVTATADIQLIQLLPGSPFQWQLNTWNQGSDDLRGINVIAVIGNLAGTDAAPNTSDGAVPLTSGSLSKFIDPSLVRVIPACHMQNMPSFVCSGPALIYVDSAAHTGYRIVNSFLAGTSEWQTLGHALAADPVLSRYGGIAMAFEDNNGNPVSSVTGVTFEGGQLLENLTSDIFFSDLFPSATYNFSIAGSGGPASYSWVPAAGTHDTVLLKAGPRIASVAAATGPLPTLSRAPGMLVSVYGDGLSNATLTVASQPVQVLYASDLQINGVLPDAISGLVQFTASSPAGSQSVNLFIEAAVPALFLGLVFHEDGSLVSTASPALPGEMISLDATGLGAAPVAVPQVSVGGQAAAVSNIANPAPGVNQVYFAIPLNSGTGNAILIVLTSGPYSSNAIAVPIASDPSN
jgi:uncharacterized protein (TIGR03437 family)